MFKWWCGGGRGHFESENHIEGITERLTVVLTKPVRLFCSRCGTLMFSCIYDPNQYREDIIRAIKAFYDRARLCGRCGRYDHPAESRKVYVVMQRDRPDSRVRAVCSTREAAEEYIGPPQEGHESWRRKKLSIKQWDVNGSPNWLGHIIPCWRD